MQISVKSAIYIFQKMLGIYLKILIHVNLALVES